MNAKRYLTAKMRHTQLGREPIVLDILAAGSLAGPEGFHTEDVVRTCGHTAQEVRMAIDEMKDRSEVQNVDGKIMLTIRGRKLAEKTFFQTVREKHFDTAVFWIKRLLDSDEPGDFREANSWLAQVERDREGGDE